MFPGQAKCFDVMKGGLSAKFWKRLALGRESFMGRKFHELKKQEVIEINFCESVKMGTSVEKILYPEQAFSKIWQINPLSLHQNILLNLETLRKEENNGRQWR